MCVTIINRLILRIFPFFPFGFGDISVFDRSWLLLAHMNIHHVWENST